VPTWLAIALGVVGGLGGLAALAALGVQRYLGKRRRARADPSLDLGARYFDDEERAFLATIVARAPAPGATAAGAVDYADASLWAGAQALDGYRGDREALEEAAAELGDALEADPERVAAWVGLAEAAHLACYSHSDGLGDFYWRGGLSLAEPLVDRALALAAGDADALAMKASYRRARGYLDEAEAILAKAPAGHWRVRVARAAVLADREKRSEAVAELEGALASAPSPRRAKLENTLGSLLVDLGRFDLAVAAFDRAVAADARYPWAWHNRALALHRAGRDKEALESSDRALAIGEFGAARQLNDRLRRRLGAGTG
jgi:tetratricopeptide (TPR) repeat protein